MNWRRILAYILLIVGGFTTFLSGNISAALSLPIAVVQIAALICIVSGAVLFYSVRQSFDRASTYQQAFKKIEPIGDKQVSPERIETKLKE